MRTTTIVCCYSCFFGAMILHFWCVSFLFFCMLFFFCVCCCCSLVFLVLPPFSFHGAILVCAYFVFASSLSLGTDRDIIYIYIIGYNDVMFDHYPLLFDHYSIHYCQCLINIRGI